MNSGASAKEIALFIGSSQSKNFLNRNTIKRIKKDLVTKDPKYTSLVSKFLGMTRSSSKSALEESSPEKQDGDHEDDQQTGSEV